MPASPHAGLRRYKLGISSVACIKPGSRRKGVKTNLDSIQRLLVRDLNHAFENGIEVEDMSSGHAEKFTVRVTVIALVSDYRGFEAMLNQRGAPSWRWPCMRCWMEGIRNYAREGFRLNKFLYGPYYCHLPAEHAMRDELQHRRYHELNNPFQAPCDPHMPPPLPRTSSDFKLNRVMPQGTSPETAKEAEAAEQQIAQELEAEEARQLAAVWGAAATGSDDDALANSSSEEEADQHSSSSSGEEEEQRRVRPRLAAHAPQPQPQQAQPEPEPPTQDPDLNGQPAFGAKGGHGCVLETVCRTYVYTCAEYFVIGTWRMCDACRHTTCVG